MRQTGHLQWLKSRFDTHRKIECCGFQQLNGTAVKTGLYAPLRNKELKFVTYLLFKSEEAQVFIEPTHICNAASVTSHGQENQQQLKIIESIINASHSDNNNDHHKFIITIIVIKKFIITICYYYY